MIDSDGHLNSMIYEGNGEYQKTVLVYEKKPAGSVHTAVEELFPNRFEYKPFTYEFPYFIYTSHWVYAGTAANPYFEAEYKPEEMSGHDILYGSIQSAVFSFSYDNIIEYKADTIGNIEFSAVYKNIAEYSDNTVYAEAEYESEILRINIFPGRDGNLFLCAAVNEGEDTCTSHFYVFEPLLPKEFYNTIDLSADKEAFLGMWRSIGYKFDIDDVLVPFDGDNFDIYEIAADNTLVLFRNSGKDEFEIVRYNYQYADIGYFIEIEDVYRDPDILTKYYINTSGNMMMVSYRMNENNLPDYIVYWYFVHYGGTADEYITSMRQDE